MIFIISYYMYLNRMLQFQKFYSNQGVKTTQNCPATNLSSNFWNFSSHFCNKYYFHLFKSPGHGLWSTASLIYYHRKLCTSLFYLRLLFITENVIKRGFNFAKYQIWRRIASVLWLIIIWKFCQALFIRKSFYD